MEKVKDLALEVGEEEEDFRSKVAEKQRHG